MKKKCVLISGPTVVSDKELENALKKSAVVLTNSDNSGIESIINKQKVDLILLEVFKDNYSEIQLIKEIKARCSKIEIIVLNSDCEPELIAKAFEYGANDAFRKPYDRGLLVERLKAIMKDKKNF